jgi:hypothetical protein
VTVRLVDGLSIRKQWLMPTIHGAIGDSQRADFRIVEFNVLGNHVHLVVEADGAASLANGMKGFEARLAKRLNRALRRTGTVFDGRYHVRALRTPTEVRNVLRYVLLNARHHAADAGRTLDRRWIDSYSSAPWFDGWNTPVRVERHVVLPPRPTTAPTTWLLRAGWRRFGLLSPDDVPGQRRPRSLPTQPSPPSPPSSRPCSPVATPLVPRPEPRPRPVAQLGFLTL